MFNDQLLAAISSIARDIEVEPAALLAIIEVESGGRLTARVEGRDEPLIRFEGHYFYRQLGRLKRNRAVAAGLAHPSAGRVANPLRQAGRWKMLWRACAIDRPAAFASTSWGVGQVMGAHWRWLGFASIDAFVARARSGAEGQVEIMARYIAAAGLIDCIGEQDWAGFARTYNGPGSRRYRYDAKLAEAYRRHGGQAAGAGRHAMALLRLGSHGAAVEALQFDLRQLGHPLIADGDFGPATRAALRAFQQDAGLVVDGVLGPKTAEAIVRALPPARLSV